MRAGPWVCRLHGGLSTQICRLCRVCVRVGVLQAACVLRVCVCVCMRGIMAEGVCGGVPVPPTCPV